MRPREQESGRGFLLRDKTESSPIPVAYRLTTIYPDPDPFGRATGGFELELAAEDEETMQHLSQLFYGSAEGRLRVESGKVQLFLVKRLQPLSLAANGWADEDTTADEQ